MRDELGGVGGPQSRGFCATSYAAASGLREGLKACTDGSAHWKLIPVKEHN